MVNLISIITINYNNSKGLEKTLNSVFKQTCLKYEYIIIDGGSTDGSKEIIEINCDKFSYWISEKDSGIYNAMNKGIVQAKGQYIQFLNSGDVLENNGTLEYVTQFILNNNFDIYYSDVINIRTNLIHNYPTKLTFKYFFDFTINHQSVFFKRELFELYGNYNEAFKIVSDWEFFMKILFIHNRSYFHIPMPIIAFDYETGISTAPQSISKIEEERLIVLNKYFSNLIPDFIFFQAIESSNSWIFLKKINKFKSWFKLKKT